MSNVVIIGAGASGLMAGIIAARSGHRVTILEKCDKPAKKIYATGNGRCNYTNLVIDDEAFRGSDASFAYEAYSRFDNNALQAFFNELGVISKDINGYVYPNSEQAKTIAGCLISEINRLNIKLVLNTFVSKIEKQADKFIISSDKEVYKADKLIITVGGKASPNLGSDGSLFSCIKKLGHSIIPTVPALTSLLYANKGFSILKGVRYKCNITLSVDDMNYYNKGEIIFNNDNINGIPVMQLSRYAAYGFMNNKNINLSLDLIPDYTEKQLYEYLSELLKSPYSEDKSVFEVLNGLMHEKLISFILKSLNISEKEAYSDININVLHKLVRIFKCFNVPVRAVSGFENAQVTAGGVSTKQIDKNMQSLVVNNLYFAGEVLDIDGNCGGYNLQWAFTSGYIAGQLL